MHPAVRGGSSPNYPFPREMNTAFCFCKKRKVTNRWLHLTSLELQKPHAQESFLPR